MPRLAKKPAGVCVRDPDRTRCRILEAALKEFSAHGFAGARVDVIARRAKINKRMLYHYFGDKEGLSRAVLLQKISERRNRVSSQAAQAGLVASLPIWFSQNCQDADWVRLLAWESLQTEKNLVPEEKVRRRTHLTAVAGVKAEQAAGQLRNDVDAAYLQLAKISLTMFPMALPQLARLTVGRSPHDPRFQREYARFLGTISNAFRPLTANSK